MNEDQYQVREFSPAGKLLVIETQQKFKPADLECLQATLESLGAKLGCTFMVLDAGMTMRDPSAPVLISDDQMDALAGKIAKAMQQPPTA